MARRKGIIVKDDPWEMQRRKEFARRLNNFMAEKDVTTSWLSRESGYAQTCICAAVWARVIPPKQRARMMAIALDKPHDVFDDLYLPITMEGEEWKPINRCPKYLVSNMGRIANAETARIKKTQLNSNGYEIVVLNVGGGRHIHSVHRLVAEAFLDGDGTGLDVNHKFGDKTDNRASMLEWNTRSENIRHAFDVLNKDPGHRTRIRCVETGKEYGSVIQCARDMGCDRGEIFKQMIGKRSHVKDYHFERISKVI